MKEFELEDIRKLEEIVLLFKKNYGIGIIEAIKLTKQEEFIPLEIFNSKLSPFECIVKYLKENKGMRLKDIAILLDKKVPACWTAYKNSCKKFGGKISVNMSEYDIPFTKLKPEKLSILELVCVYLKDTFELSYHDIGIMIQRNEKTVWTCYNRAKKK